MKVTLNSQRAALALFATALTVVSFAGSSVAQDKMMKHDGGMMKKADAMKKTAMAAPIGYNGYCAVCVVEHKKWEKGNPEIRSRFDGVDYYFPTDSIKAVFDANPQKYVPVLNGDCIVCYEKHGKRIAGSVEHAAFQDGRVFLFPSEAEKQMFVADGGAYADSDLAVKGECIVCLAKMNKHVPGSVDHTVIHNGLRYLFPSENEANAFRKSPKEFVAKVSMMDKVSMAKSNENGVRLVGRSGCAACEFGVTPLSAPDQLGLAIVGKDGNITVLEDAHKNYPSIYADRFAGKQLAVEGTIVKTEGKISWLNPSAVKVIN